MMKWELRAPPAMKWRGSINKKKEQGRKHKLNKYAKRVHGAVPTIFVSLWEFVCDIHRQTMKARWEKLHKLRGSYVKNLVIGKSLSSFHNLCLPSQVLYFLNSNTCQHLPCLSVGPKSYFLCALLW